MARISDDELNALRAHADIVDVISHYLHVHKQGRNYKAVCPFHDDHDPSMTINPDMQIYKCFVCGAGGNVFTFVKNYEKVSFVEAVGRVANLTGYHLSVEPTQQVKKTDPHVEALHRVLNETIRFTQYELDTPIASKQKEYLEKRGLDQKVREYFEIGYNPSNNELFQFLKAKQYSEQDMVGANVVRVNERGAFDVFADRITFPIHDRNGNPIGFSARTLNPENPSKYINTNETDLFKKGDIVYNAHRAREIARREGKIYIAEGVTDVIAFYRAGIQNCVCTLGTSCTTSQIRLLKSLAPRLVFCYDGDNAGQSATYRALKMAKEAGCDVGVVRNTTGLDPDEIIRKNGQEALQALVKDEITYMEFVVDFLAKRTNMNSYQEKKDFAKKMQEEIAQLPDEMDRNYFLDQVSEMTGIHLEQHALPKQQPVYDNGKQRTNVPNGTKDAQEMILVSMMKNADAIRIFEEDLAYLPGQQEQVLAMMIVDQGHSNGIVDVNQLIDEAEDQELKNYISGLVLSSIYQIPYDENVMHGAIRKIRIATLQNESDKIKEQLDRELNKESKDILLKKYLNCVKELRRYIDEERN